MTGDQERRVAQQFAPALAEHVHQVVQGFDTRERHDVDAFLRPVRFDPVALLCVERGPDAPIYLARLHGHAAGHEGLLQQFPAARAVHDQHARAGRQRELRMSQQRFAVETRLRHDIRRHLHRGQRRRGRLADRRDPRQLALAHETRAVLDRIDADEYDEIVLRRFGGLDGLDRYRREGDGDAAEPRDLLAQSCRLRGRSRDQHGHVRQRRHDARNHGASRSFSSSSAAPDCNSRSARAMPTCSPSRTGPE
jgi:hypothetical protein